MNQTTRAEFLPHIRNFLLEAHAAGRKAVTFREDSIFDVMEADGRRGGISELPVVCEEVARGTGFIVKAGTSGHYNVIHFVS